MAEYSKSEYTPEWISREQGVRFVDPNPSGEIVPPEDLFIYVKLKARQKTKSIITEGVNKNKYGNDIILSVPQKTVESVAGNKLFQPKDYLTTDWTEIGGHLTNSEKLYIDYEGFGITNIDIEIKSQTSPKVVIDFIDVRGATLFEQGSCSPYGLFFSLPYPIFELTVKGYYGKPVNYYLNLVKFNSKFNSDTGNMECRAEFIGYTFAFLADVIVWYVLSSQFLKENDYQPRQKLRNKYIATKEYYNTGRNVPLPGDIAEPWCDNPQIGQGKCTTIGDLLTFLKTFDETSKPEIVASPDYKEVTDLIQLETNYKTYRGQVYELIKKLTEEYPTSFLPSTSKQQGPSRFVFSDDEVNRLTTSGGTISSYLNTSTGYLKESIKNVLTFKVNNNSVYKSPYNIFCGVSSPDQFDQPTQPTTYNLYDTNFFKNSNWLSSKIKSNLGYSSPTTTNDVVNNVTTNFIDLGYVLQDIEEEIKKITGDNGILTQKRRLLIDNINALIEQKLGFRPSIRNIFTVILCNTDAFMDVLLDVYAKAEKYHDDNKGELENFRKNNGSTSSVISGEEKVYPWPTYIKKAYVATKGNSTKQGEKEVFPGRDFPNWWEVRFVEDFIKAMLEARDFLDILDDKTEGKPGYDNYVPTNPLESRMWYKNSPIKYTKKTSREEIYQIIGERMFITLDHTFFQPIRLTDDALYIPKIGVGDNWNPLQKAEIGDDNVTARSGEIDSWNLLTSVDTLNTLSSICNEVTPESFIQEVEKQLTLNGSLTTFKGSQLKKVTLTKTYDQSNTEINYTYGFKDDDTFYVYKPNGDGSIILKNDRDNGDIKIYSDPHKMDPSNLIMIIEAPNGQPVQGFQEINFPDNNNTGQKLKASLDNWARVFKKSINDINFATSAFNQDDEKYPKELTTVFEGQKIVEFRKNQMFSTFIMSFLTTSNSINWSSWWEDSDGNFTKQTKESYGGEVVSNMGLITYWNKELGVVANEEVNGVALFKNDFVKEITGFNAITSEKVPNDTQFLEKFIPETAFEGTKAPEIELNDLYSGLITTPIWLDNVNNFRKLARPNADLLNPETQNKNLAYLFLHSLKSTPFIKRIIDDDGRLYSIKNQSDGNPSLIWSLKAFNSIAGVSKVPKAWLLTLGSQLWRWGEFVNNPNTKNTDGTGGWSKWKKPLNCYNCGNGETPEGNDPLIQPGFNSFESVNVRKRWKWPTNDSKDTNNDVLTVYTRNHVDTYLKGVYGGQNRINYNKNINKSVFGSNYQNREYGQIIHDIGGDSDYDVIGFRYFSFVKEKCPTCLGELGKATANLNSGGSNRLDITKDYSWPFIYIAPHHIPYVSPEVFNDGDDGGGTNFVLITDQWIGLQDYVTLMPNTIDGKNYDESTVGTSEITTTNPQYLHGPGNINGEYTTRSRYEDGNLGMVIQYLPDNVKNYIVKIFEDWTISSEWNDMLKIIDPINFDTSASVRTISPSKYSYFNGDKTPAYNLFNGLLVDNWLLAPNQNETLMKLLTDQYWILNSTPKIWYGIGDTNNNNNFNLNGNEGFVVSEKQLTTYLTSFYTNYRASIEDRKKDLVEQGKEEISGLGDTILDDDDIKLSLYRTFKSLSDKWISASSTGKLFFNIRETGTGSSCGGRGSTPKATLASHFEYVNRVMGDIGDIAVIDITKLNELKDNKKISLYQYISDLLTENEYMFFPLPTYVNFGVKGVKDEDVLNMFRPVLSLDDVSCGPLFLCMFVGGSSRQLKMKTNVNCPIDQEILDNIEDDGFSFQDPNKPDEIANPNDPSYQSEGYTAFRVLYGAENQNHFKNIQLDQSEFSETAESLLVIDKLTQQGGNDKSSKGQNLNAMYLTRSYTCTIESLGNMMIQPMSYFDLQGVPMFSGAFIITEVRHNIKPNHATTTFKGVRQPRATVPIVTDAAVAMNISFKGVTPSTTGRPLSEVVKGGDGTSVGTTTEVFSTGEFEQIITKEESVKTPPTLDEILTVMNKNKGVFYSEKRPNTESGTRFLKDARNILIKDGVYDPNKPYIIYTDPYVVNIVGIRNFVQTPNSFDDYLAVFYKDPTCTSCKNNWQFKVWQITTDPGVTGGQIYTVNTDPTEAKSKLGAGFIAEGQYVGSHITGIHLSKYSALSNQRPMLIYRDNDKDIWAEKRIKSLTLDTPNMNIHASGTKTSSLKEVDDWSAGCQVFKLPGDYMEFLDIVLTKAKNPQVGSSTTKVVLGQLKNFIPNGSTLKEGDSVPVRSFTYTLLNTAEFGKPANVPIGDPIYEHYIPGGARQGNSNNSPVTGGGCTPTSGPADPNQYKPSVLKDKSVGIKGGIKWNDIDRKNQKYLWQEYAPLFESNSTIKSLPKGIKLLMVAQAIQEGYFPKEGNSRAARAYTTKNPGNIGNTDSGKNTNLGDIVNGTLAQAKYIYSSVNKLSSAPQDVKNAKGKTAFYGNSVGKEITIANDYSSEQKKCVPGVKFLYEPNLYQYLATYATGPRSNNNYLNFVTGFFNYNGVTITPETKIIDLFNIT
jgi:hypothetical protein